MKEKNLAIIGASYLQVPLIKKAKEIGYITHVFAWKCGDVGEKEADFFYPISIVEKDIILEECKKINICGICSIASDLAMLTVNYIATKLSLTSNSMECTYKSTNKHLMRKCFEENGDPSPKSIIVDEKTDIEKLHLVYPVIIKPTDRSGSRGIFKLDDSRLLKESIVNSIMESFEKKALVEEFALGAEYSVEYISFNGNHRFLALTLKYTTGAPHFIETGHLEPAPIEDKLCKKVQQVIEHALTSLGIMFGASHSEIKIDEHQNIKIIEIGARMGGDCIGSDLVHYSTGYDFVKMVIQVACGLAPDMNKEKPVFPTEVKFILTNEDMEKFLFLKQNHPEKILKVVDFHPERIGETTDSSNRCGCYLVRY